MKIRTIAGTLTFLGACVGMKNLPVSWFVLITQTAPFFTAVLQCCWLKLKVSPWDFAAMIGAYSGIILLCISGYKAAQLERE